MRTVFQVAFEDGTSTSYALSSSQERGQMFIGPGVDIYKGQIVGIHQRPGDLSLNVCKKKAATNIRSNKEQTGSFKFYYLHCLNGLYSLDSLNPRLTIKIKFCISKSYPFAAHFLESTASNFPYSPPFVVILNTPLDYSLDDCIEYIQEDELVEVTPLSIRMCKNPKIAKKTR